LSVKPAISTHPSTAPITEQSETLPIKRLAEELSATRLWLIRHAEVEERYHHVFGGRIDMDLSARGHQQARALARYLEGRRIDACYASPMKRVSQTRASITSHDALKPVIVQELREVDFGDWTGLHWSEIQERYGVSAYAWLEQLECDGIRNAESSRALRKRVEPFLRQVLREHKGQAVAIVCHGGIIRVLLSMLLDWPLPKLATLEIDYASLTQVSWTPPIARLELANLTPWRDLS
jgi:broad specificity phosphatase PhoE